MLMEDLCHMMANQLRVWVWVYQPTFLLNFYNWALDRSWPEFVHMSCFRPFLLQSFLFSPRRWQWDWSRRVSEACLWGRLGCGRWHQWGVGQRDPGEPAEWPQRAGSHGGCGGCVVKRECKEAGHKHPGVWDWHQTPASFACPSESYSYVSSTYTSGQHMLEFALFYWYEVVLYYHLPLTLTRVFALPFVVSWTQKV